MNTIATITWLTFHEARRRRMVLAALVLGVLFLVMYGLGLGFIVRELRREGEGDLVIRQVYNVLVVAGLYVIHFLTIMLTIFASVDTVAGEISSHTIQSIVTKPVRRWQVVLGKWLGYVTMLVIYLGLLSGGVLLITQVQVSYVPPNALQGLGLLALESVVLLSLSLLGGTRFSTLTNGVVLFMLYSLAFIGSWVEQIGAVIQSQAAVRIGIIASLVMPVEALWRRTAYLLQPPLAGGISFSPFASASLPSSAMVIYAGCYALVALLLAMRAFGKRDL